MVGLGDYSGAVVLVAVVWVGVAPEAAAMVVAKAGAATEAAM